MAAVPDVLSSAKFIASHSEHVTICQEGIQKGAEILLDNWQAIDESNDNHVEPFEPANLTDVQILEWIFLVDTLNFCFWSDSPRSLFTMELDGKQYTGYYSMVACLYRAVKEGVDIYKPSVYGRLTLSELRHIFRSSNDTEMPLIERRLENLHETAEVLKKVFDGSVSELVKRANKSAQRMVQLLASNFPSYRDVGVYKGVEVSFLKRAQILVSDLWSRFNGEGYGEFHDIDTLTMFPDYRVPQALLDIGALKYSNKLRQILEDGTHLDHGSDEEMEIRGCSVQAVELIRQAFSCMLLQENSTLSKRKVFTCQIDYFFWKYAKAHSSAFPIHKTFTIFY